MWFLDRFFGIDIFLIRWYCRSCFSVVEVFLFLCEIFYFYLMYGIVFCFTFVVFFIGIGVFFFFIVGYGRRYYFRKIKRRGLYRGEVRWFSSFECFGDRIFRRI